MKIRLLLPIGLAALASCASTRAAHQPDVAKVRMAVAQKLADEGATVNLAGVSADGRGHCDEDRDEGE